jgi:hypothetical protein
MSGIGISRIGKVSSGDGGDTTLYSKTQTFVPNGNTYDFVIVTPPLLSFNIQYLENEPGDKLPATLESNSITLHFNYPPAAGVQFTVKVLGQKA